MGNVFLAHFGPLTTMSHALNATAYLCIVADHVIPLIATNDHLPMATSSPIMHHVTKAKVVSNWFSENTEHNNEFSYISGLQSPDLNPVEHLWDVVELEIGSMNVQLTNL